MRFFFNSTWWQLLHMVIEIPCQCYPAMYVPSYFSPFPSRLLLPSPTPRAPSFFHYYIFSLAHTYPFLFFFAIPFAAPFGASPRLSPHILSYPFFIFHNPFPHRPLFFTAPFLRPRSFFFVHRHLFGHTVSFFPLSIPNCYLQIPSLFYGPILLYLCRRGNFKQQLKVGTKMTPANQNSQMCS